MSLDVRASLPRQKPMKTLQPRPVHRLRGRFEAWWARRRLARWCARIMRLKESEFAALLIESVVMDGNSRDDPLTWIYQAMRDAAAKAAPLHEGIRTGPLTHHPEALNIRLATTINELAPDRYRLLALFMFGARCEDIAKWQGDSQEDVAARVQQITRQLAARVLRSAT